MPINTIGWHLSLHERTLRIVPSSPRRTVDLQTKCAVGIRPCAIPQIKQRIPTVGCQQRWFVIEKRIERNVRRTEPEPLRQRRAVSVQSGGTRECIEADPATKIRICRTLHAISMQVDIQTAIEVLNHHRRQRLEQSTVRRVDRLHIRIDPNAIGLAVSIVIDIERPIDKLSHVLRQWDIGQ